MLRRKGAGKSPFLFFVFMMVSVLFPIVANAAIVNVTGYNYAHTNQTGKTNMKDNAGRSYLMGDFNQNDAVIKWIQFNTTNIKGGTLFIRYDDGTTQTISGDYVTLNKEAKKVEIVLSKTTYAESLVWIDSYGTMDDSNGGTSVQYNYQDPPVSYGSLGTGQAPSTGGDTGGGSTGGGSTGGGSTGGDTGGGSTGGGSTGGDTGGGNTIGTDELDAKFNSDCSILSWTGKPTGTTQYKININGSIKMTTSMSYTMPQGVGAGTIVDVRALDAKQNELGKSVVQYTCTPPSTGGDTGGGDTGSGDTGGGGDTGSSCDACTQIKKALECPAFDEYVGKWADGVKGTYPEMAEQITDKLAPAIGDQIRQTAPDVAKAIGDDLQSREKQVQPPPAAPTFQPALPRVQDTPKVQADLNTGVPDFTPDYSEDKGFKIPDPSEIQEIGKDPGYVYPEVQNLDPPDFVPKQQKEDPDPGYKAPAETPAPEYKQEGGTSTAPDYNAGNDTPAPVYAGSGGSDGTQYYQGR